MSEVNHALAIMKLKAKKAQMDQISEVMFSQCGLCISEAHHQTNMSTFKIIDGEDLVALIHYTDTVDIDMSEYTLTAVQLASMNWAVNVLKKLLES